jgi:hypothetical protein
MPYVHSNSISENVSVWQQLAVGGKLCEIH